MDGSVLMSRTRLIGDRSIKERVKRALIGVGVRGWCVQPEIKGKPDIAFIAEKVAIFLNECFWHGCDEHYTIPKTRQMYWTRKIRDNRRRDEEAVAALIAEGWKVFRVWEHDLQDDTELKGIALRVARAIDTKSEADGVVTFEDVELAASGATYNAPCKGCGGKKRVHEEKWVNREGTLTVMTCLECFRRRLWKNGAPMWCKEVR